LAGSRRIVAGRAELDRINVYPVPDGDTGTNLALTVRSMAEAVRAVTDRSISGVAARLAEAGLVGARGNSGMMLSHFFLGFAEGLAGCRRAGPVQLARAVRRAADSLYQAVERPVEGTILTVVRDSAEAAERFASGSRDLVGFARRMLSVAQASLERTHSLLPALREANVVDAGVKGFVLFLEGVVSLIEGGRPDSEPAADVGLDADAPAATAPFPDAADRAFRFCSEFLLRGGDLPDRRALAETVSGLGGSLIVARTRTLAKVHIHTDDPDRVRERLRRVAHSVECVKREDMRAQHRRLRAGTRRRVSIVTDSACDLPDRLIIEHGITVVPLTLMFGDRSFLDRVEIDHDQFLARMTRPAGSLPTTSQPSPAQLERAFARAAEHGGDVLGIFIAGALSGTLGQARAAAARFDGAPVRAVDSRSGSLGLGFQVLRAAELAGEGWAVDEIAAELERVRERSGLLLTLDTLDYLRRSGRIGQIRAFLASLLDLKPVLGLDRAGALVPVERVRGRSALPGRVIELLRPRVPVRRSRLRMGVAHVGCPQVAEALADAVRAEFGPDELLVVPAANVIAAHTGPGAWGVVYQAE
jgi:DegV family protein with EDD domain